MATIRGNEHVFKIFDRRQNKFIHVKKDLRVEYIRFFVNGIHNLSNPNKYTVKEYGAEKKFR